MASNEHNIKMILELSKSCQEQNIVEMSVLLENHAPSYADKFGRTALHFACENACVEAVDLLIKHSADVNYVTNDGDSPLHYAVKR